jgi:hypothetical protein
LSLFADRLKISRDCCKLVDPDQPPSLAKNDTIVSCPKALCVRTASRQLATSSRAAAKIATTRALHEHSGREKVQASRRSGGPSDGCGPPEHSVDPHAARLCTFKRKKPHCAALPWQRW